MPEWGQIPVPAKLSADGVADIVRVSDARMRGTTFDTVVLHVTPESAAGGPPAIVQDGDPILLDVPKRRLDLDIPTEEITRRREAFEQPARAYARGYSSLYRDHVLQTHEGCDVDLLRSADQSEDTLPLEVLHGWVGGR
jgi:dihydroxy-acid dehydratase